MLTASPCCVRHMQTRYELDENRRRRRESEEGVRFLVKYLVSDSCAHRVSR